MRLIYKLTAILVIYTFYRIVLIGGHGAGTLLIAIINGGFIPANLIFMLPALVLLLSFFIKSDKTQDILVFSAIGLAIGGAVYLKFIDAIFTATAIGFISWLIIYIFLRCYDLIFKHKPANEKTSRGKHYRLICVVILGILMADKFIVQLLLVFFRRGSDHFDYLFIIEFILYIISLFLLYYNSKIGQIVLIAICLYEVLAKLFFTAWFFFYARIEDDILFLLVLEPLLLGSIFLKLFSLIKKQNVTLAT